MQVGDRVRYCDCPHCATAQIVDVRHGMVRILWPDGLRTWADPAHLEVLR